MKHIFISSFIQVFLVAVNTIFLSKGYVLGIALASFLISYFWVSNVKKANIVNKTGQVIYSLGPMSGGLTGYYFTKLFI